MNKYSFSVIWSDEDDAYLATVPEFPGLSAFGDTPEEAIEEAKIALGGFIEVYKEDGCRLPEPKKLKHYSGQIRLRLPKSLHEKLSKDAQEDGVSLNTYTVTLLSKNQLAYQIEKTLKNQAPSVKILTVSQPLQISPVSSEWTSLGDDLLTGTCVMFATGESEFDIAAEGSC